MVSKSGHKADTKRYYEIYALNSDKAIEAMKASNHME